MQRAQSSQRNKMPGIAVNIAVILEGKILLTKREDFEVWCLPSGGVEEGESLAEAAIRETKEETGIDIQLTRLVGVYSRLGGIPDVHAVLYEAKPTGGELKTQPNETIEVAYFSFDELPQEIAFGHKKRIADVFHNRIGVSVRQKIKLPNEGRLTRRKLYELRDQSGLSRQQFYMQRIEQAEIKEEVEIGDV
jgi:ADP-ribose pyrophosphatase YjhB (NUDIX family)